MTEKPMAKLYALCVTALFFVYANAQSTASQYGQVGRSKHTCLLDILMNLIVWRYWLVRSNVVSFWMVVQRYKSLLFTMSPWRCSNNNDHLRLYYDSQFHDNRFRSRNYFDPPSW